MKLSNCIRAIALKIIPVCLPLGLSAQGLHITPGLHLVVSGAPSLVFNNASLINNGNFSADSSSVLFTGDGATAGSFIGGGNPIAFYNLAINRSFSDLQLNNNVTVGGRVTLNGGNLLLNNYTLDLGSSGSISGETNNSCITGVNGGVIRAVAVLNAPHAVNPGNIGVEISSDADLGLTVITRGHLQQSNSSGQTSINRYFDFAPERNSGLQATLRFFYLDGELADKNKNGLALYSSMQGRDKWSLWGRDKTDPAENWIVKSNIDQLHRFTLAMTPSNTVTEPGRGAAVQIFPNPSHDVFTLALFSDKEKKEFISLYDLSGHLLERKEVYCKAGLNSIAWNIAGYAGGVYYLGFENRYLRNIKIVKQ
ncbi:MAG TPA: T9SS type A sorting domain-containing protein [Puia sp.]|nr:T9SS type A sorting domain-containing protein [Puia sp.]